MVGSFVSRLWSLSLRRLNADLVSKHLLLLSVSIAKLLIISYKRWRSLFIICLVYRGFLLKVLNRLKIVSIRRSDSICYWISHWRLAWLPDSKHCLFSHSTGTSWLCLLLQRHIEIRPSYFWNCLLLLYSGRWFHFLINSISHLSCDQSTTSDHWYFLLKHFIKYFIEDCKTRSLLF